MKRSRLKPGAKSVERGSTFANHGNGLARDPSKPATGRPSATPTNPKRRKAKRPDTEIERRKQAIWWEGWERALCAVCRAQGCDPHHIVTETRCRERARELGLEEHRVAWDLRNRLWLCRRHHDAHHNWSKRITWELLERAAPKVFQFVRELDLEPWLERRYPKNQPTGGSTE